MLTSSFSQDFGINNSGQHSFGNGLWSQWQDRNVDGGCQTSSYRDSLVCHWSRELRWKGFPKLLPICQLGRSHQTEFSEHWSVCFPMELRIRVFKRESWEAHAVWVERVELALYAWVNYFGQQAHLVSNRHRTTVQHGWFTLIWPSPDNRRHALAWNIQCELPTKASVTQHGSVIYDSAPDAAPFRRRSCTTSIAIGY